MTTRRGHLCKPGHSGVYRVPQDIAQVRAAVLQEGGSWRVLDMTGVADKRALLQAIARTLEFPEHFGRNWDALADSLQDLSWLSWAVLVIEVRGWGDFARAAADDARMALDIARDAAIYWAGREKTFIVLVDVAPDLPSLA